MSAIFISHSSRDRQIAAELMADLKALGHRSVFLDFDPQHGIPVGRDWEREIYSQLRSCQGVVVLCSEHSLGSRWCFAEIAQARALGKPLFPLKVGSCDVGDFKSEQVWDLTEDREAAIQALSRGLQLAGLDPTDAFDWDGTRPPYPGLLAFEKEDAAVFFGREPEVYNGMEMLRRLRSFSGPRLLLVHGPSGSGKSSLVRAGLLPRLTRDKRSWWPVGPMRPGEDPLRVLSKSLAEALSDSGREVDWTEIRESLIGSENGTGKRILDWALELRGESESPDATVVVLVDQAEELFRAALGETNEVHRFLSDLEEAIEGPRVQGHVPAPLLVVAALRSDALGALQQHPVAGRWTFESLSVGPMSAGCLASVIQRPADIAGLELDPDLTPELVAETQGPSGLPLLAFTLRELYESLGRKRRLGLQRYREFGGISGSVARAAEAAFAAECSSLEAEEELRRAFLALARIDEEGHFARKRVVWREIAQSTHSALNRFVQARLLVSGEEGGERFLEVAHETIFRSWRRLCDWLNEDRELLLWKRRLTSALEDWENAGHDNRYLLSGPVLDEGKSWLRRRGQELSPGERRFLRRSQRVAARKRATAVAFVVLGAVAVLGGLIAGAWLRQQAQSAATTAESEARRARDLSRIRVARDWLERDPTVAGLVLSELEEPDEGLLGLQSLREAIEEGIAMAEFRVDGDLVGASFSADGEQVITVTMDGVVECWPADGTGFSEIMGEHESVVRDAVFSPDARRLLTISRDGTAEVWATDRGGERRVLEVGEERVFRVIFSPDGSKLGAVSDTSVWIWEADGSGVPFVLPASESSPVFAPDSSKILSVSSDGMTMQSVEEQGRTVWLKKVEWVRSAAFSPDGRKVATVAGQVFDQRSGDFGSRSRFPIDTSVRIWNSDGSGEPANLRGHYDYVNSASFSPDSARLVSASSDGTVRVWRLDGTGPPRVFQEEGQDFLAATFSRDGEKILARTRESAWVWNLDGKGRRLHLRRVNRNQLVSASFDPEETKVITAWRDGLVRVWNLTRLSADITLGVDLNEHVRYASFSRDSTMILTAARAGTTRIWNTGDFTNKATFHHGSKRSRVYASALSPDGSRIVNFVRQHVEIADNIATREFGAMQIRNVDGNRRPVILGSPDDQVLSARFSPDAFKVLTISPRGERRIWWADGSEEAIQLGKGRVEFSRDGSRVVTVSQRGEVEVMEVDDPQRPRVLIHASGIGGNPERVRGAAFDPSGARILTVSEAGTHRVWSANGTGELGVIGRPGEDLIQTDFSPDGAQIATVSRDGAVRVWKTDGSGEVLTLIEAHRVRDEGREEGDSLEELALRIRAVAEGRRQWRPRETQEFPDGVRSVAFSPDGKKILTVSKVKAVLFSVDGASAEVILGGSNLLLWEAEFSPDGRRIAIATEGGSVYWWTTGSSKHAAPLAEHPKNVREISFSADSAQALAISDDGTAYLWDLEGGEEPVRLRSHLGRVETATFSTDGQRILLVSEYGPAAVLDANDDGKALFLQEHVGSFKDVAFTPDGRKVLAVDARSERKVVGLVWAAEGGGPPKLLPGHRGIVKRVSFRPDGKEIATASTDWSARLWDLTGRDEPRILLGHSGRVLDVSYSSDGTRVVTASADGTARVWSVEESGEPIVLEGHLRAVLSASFSRDGTRVVTGSRDQTARIWNADGSGMPVVIEGHDGTVLDAEFSPDGKKVVTASLDGTARVVNSDGSGDVVVLAGHFGGVLNADFDSQGERILTSSKDGTTRIWNMDGSEEPIVLSLKERSPFGDTSRRLPNGTIVRYGGDEVSARYSTFSDDGSWVLAVSTGGTAQVWIASASKLRNQLRQATSVCLASEFRQKFLGEPPTQASARYEDCERRMGRVRP